MIVKRIIHNAARQHFSWLLAGLALLLCSSIAYAEDITINNNTTWPSGTYSYDNVLITNNAVLTLESNSSTGEGVILNVSNLTIDSGASISASGRGYPSSGGPGEGTDSTLYGSGGAGYGGDGGDGGDGQGGAGGITYGSVTQPSDLGSGGGRNTKYSTILGGSGGGLIRIECLGTLTVDGAILANGNNGIRYGSTSYSSGGGSGGSIYIDVGTLAGSGLIDANGGSGGGINQYSGGGGAGGRIALYYISNSYTGEITAYGGAGISSSQYGASGTVFTKSDTQAFGDLMIDNNGNSGGTTVVPDGTYDFDTITVKANAKLALSADAMVNAFILITENGGVFYYDAGTINLAGSSLQGVTYIDTDLTTSDITIPSEGILYLNAALTVPNLTILDGGVLTHSSSDSDFSLTVTGDLTIAQGGKIDVSGRGYPSSGGPGEGTDSTLYGSGGAGYGGDGGDGGDGQGGAGGITYGSVTQPSDLGSGGGRNTKYSTILGGSGGGLIRIECLGTLTVDGAILANGNNGIRYGSTSYSSGGGSGGSIYIDVGTLAGSGLIDANGGSGGGINQYSGGGGAGGRIALYYISNSYTGEITAYGGAGISSSQYGASGTVFTKSDTQAFGDLMIDNNGNSGGTTVVPDGTYDFDTITVKANAKLALSADAMVNAFILITENGGVFYYDAGTINLAGSSLQGVTYIDTDLTTSDITIPSEGILYLNAALTVPNLTILDGGVLTHSSSDSDFSLTVTGDLTIAQGGKIDVSGRGYPSSGGPGEGTDSTLYGSGGAGYGGDGGDGQGGAGGITYGSVTQPSDLGSGGGRNTKYSTILGGSGGGLIRIECLGTLTVDGAILANGNNGIRYGSTSYSSGGGSGGSIYIDVGTLAGSGLIDANGGSGGGINQYSGGGGAGGRIALYYISNSYTGEITAYGGAGISSSQYGASGTVFTKSDTQAFGDLMIDNNGNSGGTTVVPDGTYDFDTITVKANAKLALSADAMVNAFILITENGGVFYYDAGTINLAGSSLQGVTYIDTDLTTSDITIPSEGILYLNAALTVPNLTILDGGVLTHSSSDSDFSLTVTGDLTIAQGGKIDVSGRGYPSSGGPGEGTDSTLYGSGGAGYGGDGGDGQGGAGGITYGSVTQPSDLGSGGGRNTKYSTILGGSGGGLIRIECLGTLTVDGAILANGNNGIRYGSTSYSSGGGSGGSIYIDVGTLAGSGLIDANGGSGGGINQYSGGGGAGGRIALYYISNTYTGDITAYGGSGYQYGEDGTIYLSDLSPTVGENIQASANNEFIVEEYSQGTYSVQLDNQDSISHSANLAILNPYPDLVVTLGQENITLLSGETAIIEVYVDASTAPGVYDIQIEIAEYDGSIIYSNIKIYVTELAAGDLPDLKLTAQDVYFSNVNPFPDDAVIISARIHNKGVSATSNISVKFFEFDTLIDEVFVDVIPANSSKVASVFTAFPYSGERFIRVVVDHLDEIQELAENNNEASQILQVGSPPEFTGSILVTGHMPSTIIEDSSFTVTGKAVYEIFVNGERNTDYVVKGGSVQITVIEDEGMGREWVYADIHTDIYGNFSKVLRAPDVLGTYHVIMTVTDKTFEGDREMFFEVVSQPPPTPPLPPTSTGSGSWIDSGGGSWTWEWTSTPVHEPVPVSDVYVHSEDIYFSNLNPTLGEEISIVAYIHFWSNDTSISAHNVPVNFYVTYPGYPKMKIGETVIPSISVGEPDYGSSCVFASWKNYAEGIYIIEIEVDPSYVEDNQYNNAATRAILVGQLQSEYGAVSGHVTDPWGVVSGVTILLNDSYGTLASTVTDESGNYLFADVSAGGYDVQIIVPDGYETDLEHKATNIVSNSISVLDFHITIADDEGPVTTDVSTDLNPVQIANTVYLTAFVDDTTTGNSNIKSSEYSLDGGATWIPMDAQDGAFDSPSEWVGLTFTAPGTPGVYELCVRGTDSYDNIGPEECIFSVVYDPEGGFVTGGGWIDSPIGAYIPNPSLTGKATFGFVSKYKKGATVPTGQTEFQFKTADLNFHSDSYEWLVVTGSNYAKFKGKGTINGDYDPNGNLYKFMLWAGDDVPDTFRIRIWWEEEGDGTEHDVYDNGFDQAITGGSIVIHTK